MSGLGQRFITEKDAEVRRKTQEAEGVTAQPYDARSLYERLQIEKDRKQEEFEAQIALKNRVHRLDEEEVEYLQTLAAKQHRVEEEHEKEVAALLKEAQASRPSGPALASNIPSSEVSLRPVASINRPSQRSLLANVLKRPGYPDETGNSSQPKRTAVDQSDSSTTLNGSEVKVDSHKGDDPPPYETLPGLADYNSESESDSNSISSKSTDVEDAACTLLEVASSRGQRNKSMNSEEC